MKEREMDELERILADVGDLQPSTGFSTRVMRAVREESTAMAPIAFPWARFLPGFVLNLGLFLGAAVWILLEPGSFSPTQFVSFEALADPKVQGLLGAALATMGTGVLAWTVSRWVAPRRIAYF